MSAHDTAAQLVLLADDGAPASDVAWTWLTGHRWGGSRLQTVTVQETIFPGGPELGHIREVPRQPPAESGFVSWEHLSRKGDPRTVLANRPDASLIVVGTHHRGHLTALLAGSTSEWLLVRPPVPLVIARHGHPTGSVAICVDGSTHSQRALEAFLALPWSPDVAVTLVSVADGVVDVESSLALAKAAFGGRTPPTMVRLAGAARREIPAFVRANGVDLVVLGTRGLTGLTRLAVGSAVSALMKDETANLLVAHADEDGAAAQA